MAKYLPTIDAWSTEGDKLLRSGKVQPGQWISCGKGPKSRFVGVAGYSLRATHSRDNIKAASTKRFKAMREAYRKEYN